MRKLILGVASSLDAFIEGPAGEFDWCFTDQDYGMAAFLQRIDAVFMGRKSYELMVKMGKEGEIPGMPPVTEYVFSNTLSSVRDGSVLLTGKGVEEARKIKAQPGKDIWLFGGASLTSAMLNAGLVDEIWLAVHPILLGAGKPLFTDLLSRRKLQLLESTAYDTGLVSLRYSLEN